MKILDGVLLLGLMGWLLWQGYYEVGLLTAAAFFVDDRLSAENRHELVLGGVSLALTGVVFLLRRQPLIVNLSGASVAVLGGDGNQCYFVRLVDPEIIQTHSSV